MLATVDVTGTWQCLLRLLQQILQYCNTAVCGIPRDQCADSKVAEAGKSTM